MPNLSEFPELNYFVDYIEFWTERDPNFPWIRYHDQEITASTIKSKIELYAKYLIAMELQKGDILLTILPNCPEFLYLFFATQLTGVIIAPLDIRYKTHDLREFLSQTRPKMVVYIPQFGDNDIGGMLGDIKPEFSQQIRYVPLEPMKFDSLLDLRLISSEKLEHLLKKRRESIKIDDDNLIIFTGGTTGRPKGALLTHRNIVKTIYYEMLHIAVQSEKLGIQGRPPLYHGLPNSHVGGILELNGLCFVMGMQMLLDDTWHASGQLEAIDRFHSPIMGGVPTMANIILNHPKFIEYDVQPLKLIILSGEKLELDLLKNIKQNMNASIINGYGSSEAGSEIAMTTIETPIEKLAQGFAGSPLPEVELKIIDFNGNVLDHNQEGEVLVRSPYTIKEYFRMPEQTRTHISPEGWYSTGDKGFLDTDGNLVIKGRIKQIIRVGSYTVVHSEIEELLLQDDAVAMAVAVGYPHKIYNEVVWAVIVPKDGAILDLDRLYDLCKKNLADYKVPKKILVRTKLPQTRLGKINRKILRQDLIHIYGEEEKCNM